MRVIYSGANTCSPETFKRLLLLADEIAFNDRPSVTFHRWGSVGIASPARQVAPAYAGTPVRLTVFSPPSGPANDLYRRYLPVDLASPEFRRIFLEGLRNDARFANKFVQLEANYGWGTGRQVVTALTSDAALSDVPLDIDTQITGPPFQMDNPQIRAETLRMLLAFVSIELTTTMLVADQAGYIPVTDDPYLTRLLALRASHPAYIGGTATVAPFLGLEIAKAVIPDEALQKLEIPSILEYREAAVDAYRAWNVELNRIATGIDAIDPVTVQTELPRLMAAEINPKIEEYRREMQAAADRMFGSILKNIVNWRVPAAFLASMTYLNFPQAVAAFALALAPAMAPPIVEYVVQARTQVKRSHAISYLVDLADVKGP